MKHHINFVTKLFIVVIVGLLTMGSAVMAQIVQVENFSYSTGQLTSTLSGANVSGGAWYALGSNTGNPVQVTAGSLTYTDYASSGIGNKIETLNPTTSGEDVAQTFPTQTAGTTVYASFLLNVTSTTGLALNTSTTGDYFFGFIESASTTNFVGRLSIKAGSVAGTYNIGMRHNSGNTAAAFAATDLAINTTYLIVVRYDQPTGNTNNVASVYINPTIGGSEPTPSVSQTSVMATEPADCAKFFVRQSSNTPNAQIDGFRIGTSWSSVVGIIGDANSDIIAAGNETSNLPYASFQAPIVTFTSDAQRVWSFTVRDGGASAPDADALPTKISALTISKGSSDNTPSWAGTIRQAALFDGSTFVSQVSVTGETIVFPLLNISVDDNGSKTLDLYLTFESSATDNSQYQFNIQSTNVTAGDNASTFSAFSAINSDVTGDANRVEVTASKLVFTTEPAASVAINTNFSATVTAEDANDNVDLDFTGAALSPLSTGVVLGVAAGTGTLSSVTGVSQAAVNGVASWSDLQYNTAETGVQLSANAAGVTGATSTAFTVVGLSALSDIVVGPAVLAGNISSLSDTQGEEAVVLDIIVRDGGGASDPDAVGTIVNSLTLTQSGANTAADWSQYIAGADLYRGDVLVAAGTIGATTIFFSGGPLFTAPDDGNDTLQVKIYLTAALPAGADNKVIGLLANQNTGAATDPTGSLFATGGADVTASTTIDVEATELRFVSNIANQKTGVAFNTSVKGTDVLGNIDADFTGTVDLTVNSGNGVLSGVTSAAAVSGTAAINGVIVTGFGAQVLQAASGAMSVLSNSFNVEAPATFKVAAVPGDTLIWNSAATWDISNGSDNDGIPDANDDVILNNDLKAGSYVIRFGPSVRDTAKSITIGYAGNPNTIVALIPQNNTVTGAFVVGDAVAGNIDVMVMQGGILANTSGITGTIFSIRGYSPATDSIWVRTGGKILWATKASSSGLYRTAQRLDGDYGTIEFDVPDSNAIYYYSSSGAYYPNLVFSANNAGRKTYCTSNSAGYGPCLIKGNVTVNVGAKDSLGSYADNYRILGDIINYSKFEAYSPTTVQFMGSDQQEIIGLTPVFYNGFTLDNAFGMALQTDLTVAGGTATLTNGGIITVGRTFSLNPAGSLSEVGGTIDVVEATRTVSTGVNETFGNIGFEMNPAGNAPGVTTARRYTSWINANGNQSIKRYFDVTAAGTTPYNASVVLRYLDSELNGNTEADLFLNYSTDGGTTWKGKTGTVSTSLNKVTTTTINNVGRFTLASAATPLFITHNITMKKFQNDNGIDVPGVAKKWYMALYEGSIAPENLINSGNLSVVTTGNIPAGTYICQEADSAGWAHVGHKVDNELTSNVFADTRSFDTIVVNNGLNGTFEFYNSKSSTITINKFRDLDGDPLTTGDQTPEVWGLTLYKGAVGGTPVAEGNTSSLVVNDLGAGTYIAVEADSTGWFRCNGATAYDTLVLAGGESGTITFINVKENHIRINKFQDGDGDPLTTSDQSAKSWYLELRSGSPTGTFIAGGSTASLLVDRLADGTYFAVEADSTPWVSLGYSVDGAFQTGSAGLTYGVVTVANGQSAVVNFYNAPPIYGTKFRTLNPDLLSQDRDNFNKVGKSVKNKPVGVDFALFVVAPATGLNDLHLEFGTAIDTNYPFYTVPTSAKSEVAKSKNGKWNLTFAADLNQGDTVWVYGHGVKANFQKVGSYWWTTNGVMTGSKLKNPTFTKNVKTNPMPNRINILEAAYPAAFPTGMVVGVAQTNKDSIKKYGWVLLKKATDALKTLSVTSKGVVNLHDGAARGLDSVVSGKTKKALVGKYTSLPPTKQDNILFANLVALKASIAASAQDITPVGFGDLILNDTASNPWNGLTLIQLAAKADTMMTGYAGRTFDNADTYDKLSSTIRNILNAFEGAMDTSSFGPGLKVLGAERLTDCKILKANPSATPYRIVPTAVAAEQPVEYALYQNYPNPFNPATMIQFDLPIASTVTLKIYNILGQEVATLLNNQQMEDGQQAINFNASNLSSGIYFYRITAQTVNEDGVSSTAFTSVKKMMLMK